jgi:hypothetical protein
MRELKFKMYQFRGTEAAPVNTSLTIGFGSLHMRSGRVRAREAGGLSMHPRGVRSVRP